MPMTCKACRHPLREQIDKDLLRGITLREISEKTGISQSALHRHKWNDVVAVGAYAYVNSGFFEAEEFARTVTEALRRALDSPSADVQLRALKLALKIYGVI